MRMTSICHTCFSGSTQNSWKKFILPNISTGVQKMMTVAIAIRIFAPHAAMCNWWRNMKIDPTRHPTPTRNVTG